jgi:hypothetical protein
MPRNVSSPWQASDMDCEPWSWRSERPAARPWAKPPKCWRKALREGLEGLEAGGPHRAAGRPTHPALGWPGDEHRGLALSRPGAGHVGAPDAVQRFGDDGGVVIARVARAAGPRRGEQAVLAQAPQPLTAGGPEARHAQPCPELAVTLPMEGRGREDGPDRLDQLPLRPWPGRPRWPGRQAMALDGGHRRIPPACRMSHSTGRRRSHSAGDTPERDLRRCKAKLSRAATIRRKSNRHQAR